MAKKIKPTGKQKTALLVHAVIFTIATIASLMLYDPNHGKGPWAYPWPAWTVAAWALTLLGHYCIVYTSYEDKGYDTYRAEQGKQP